MKYRSWREAVANGEFLYHHCRNIDHVLYDIVIPYRPHIHLPVPDCSGHCNFDDWHTYLDYDTAYRWLAERTGFWPLWLAVGADEDAIYMTGYASQFTRIISWSKEGNKYRKTGEFPSDVLFSWQQAPQGAFYLDYSNWHVVLNSVYLHCKDGHQAEIRDISSWWERQILRPSWKKSDWQRVTIRGTHSVQAVCPQLDLRSADLVRVRNKKEKIRLEKMGFRNVEVWRIKTWSSFS